jgi:hypothetical protein
MNAMQEIAKEGLVNKFLHRLGLQPGQGVDFLENPTDELLWELGQGRSPTVYSMGKRKKQKLVRKEENYLYSTRRFPNNTANNTIGSGVLTDADFPFFGNGVGDAGSSMGYFSISNLTFFQTNMDKGGRIPTGRGFALYELAISYNAQASPQDIAQLMDVSELRYSKNNDDFTIHHGPARLWPGGTGVDGFSAIPALGTERTFGHNGNAHLASVRRFKQPRLLSANESFTYIIRTTANMPNSNTAVGLGAFVDCCIWLFGNHYVRASD